MSNFKRIISAAVVFSIVFNMLLVSFASNSSSVSNANTISSTIENYLASDGAYAETYTAGLLNSFISDPSAFSSALEIYSTDEQERVIIGISHEAYSCDAENRFAFESVIYDSAESDPILCRFVNCYESIDFGLQVSSGIDLPEYDPDIMKTMVDSFLSSDSAESEAFFKYFSDAYKKEPIIAQSCLTGYSEKELAPLARGVASILCAEGTDIDDTLPTTNDPFRALMNKYGKTDSENSIVPRATSYIPTITSFVYTDASIEVGTPTPLSITLTETTGVSSARTYTIKVFCTRDGTEYHCATTTMTIPAGKTKVTSSATLTFSNAGTFTTRVAVYDGNTLLTTRSGASPDISHGKWKIIVTLPENRALVGAFALYDATGTQQQTGDALGQSQTNDDENVPYGNTPCGEYRGYPDGPHSNSVSYGPYRYIRTFAVDVPAIQQYGRSNGMWIHGGRTQEYLFPTDGCVRVYNNDIKEMTERIDTMTAPENGHYDEGTIIYREV